jgi:ribonucleotide monophosphatase NagD (HAD superfamily)
MRYCIDIDGTICHTAGVDYGNATPIEVAVDKIKLLSEAGNYIILFTARGSLSGQDWSEATKNQLRLWDVPYDELIFGKPAADVYIDDKALPAQIWHQLDR